jgi:hypothetical protein
VPSAEARIPTPNATAYLARLCGHLGKMGSSGRFPRHGLHLNAGGGQPPSVLHSGHTRDTGTVTLSWGQLTLHATAGLLILRAEARSAENLQRIQDTITARLLRFGLREHLDILWQPIADTATGP